MPTTQLAGRSRKRLPAHRNATRWRQPPSHWLARTVEEFSCFFSAYLLHRGPHLQPPPRPAQAEAELRPLRVLADSWNCQMSQFPKSGELITSFPLLRNAFSSCGPIFLLNCLFFLLTCRSSSCSEDIHPSVLCQIWLFSLSTDLLKLRDKMHMS